MAITAEGTDYAEDAEEEEVGRRILAGTHLHPMGECDFPDNGERKLFRFRVFRVLRIFRGNLNRRS